MGKVSAYLRPLSIDEALRFLDRQGAVVIGGGTKVNADSSLAPTVVVDLQGLHLDIIEESVPGSLLIGATATLQDLAEASEVPPTMREVARREVPSTIRTMATVGGCVVARDPESELLATLLVHDAVVSFITSHSERAIDLADLLADPGQLAGAIVTSISIATDGITTVARTARTSADRAIVAVVARRTVTGDLRIALTGVATTPVLIGPVGESLEEALQRLEPPGDFRGSSEYRLHLAAVLSKRALEEVG
ncbi:MAG: FAD binding domain-containing protein [Acidimicrobiales bacterium]